MTHRHENLPPRAYWKSAVSRDPVAGARDIYEPRFAVSPTDRIVAAGSCFAQHIGTQFKRRGYKFVDLEPGPRGLSRSDLHRFGFDLYSARYGNVYSVRQLLQLFQRAIGAFQPETVEWETNGRFYDPFRPSIEPGGFASSNERERNTRHHLQQVRRLLPQCDVFVFTFGLTEAWMDARDGAVLPSCPGTVAGTFDPERHQFVNFSFLDVYRDARKFINLARRFNADMRFLFTVSPVPLTATASGDHVLAASTYSKSVLRAVCGTLRDELGGVDYFPSFELVSSHPMKARAYHPNLRTVSDDGVSEVMDVFFAAHEAGRPSAAEAAYEQPEAAPGRAPGMSEDDDVVCDEILLEAFAP